MIIIIIRSSDYNDRIPYRRKDEEYGRAILSFKMPGDRIDRWVFRESRSTVCVCVSVTFGRNPIKVHGENGTPRA